MSYSRGCDGSTTSGMVLVMTGEQGKLEMVDAAVVEHTVCGE
jgi:hypothetical protein